jgi:hypothetical protein
VRGARSQRIPCEGSEISNISEGMKDSRALAKIGGLKRETITLEVVSKSLFSSKALLLIKGTTSNYT